MVKTFVAGLLVVACSAGCDKLGGGGKASGTTILNVGDLGTQFFANKEALRAKYEGKEVVVLGKAMKSFDPQFYGLDTQDLRLVADMSNPNHATITCTVRKVNADKFAGVKAGAIIATKGVMHVKEFGMELDSCNRELRAEKP
jgi:hypothetical protein